MLTISIGAVMCTERIGDESDIATKREELLRQDAVRSVVEKFRALPLSTGICAECEGEIEPRRLEALPTAVLCFDCAQTAEVMRKRL